MWHSGSKSGCCQELVCEQIAGKIIAQLGFIDPLLLQRAPEIFLAKLAIGTLKGRDIRDFSIDQALARGHTIFRAEIGNRKAVDQPLQYIVKAASVDKGFEIESGVLALFSTESIVHGLAEFRGGQFAIADCGSRSGAGDAAERATARHIGRGEGNGDQPDKTECQEKAQFRGKNTAEKTDHERDVPLRGLDLRLL